MAAKGNEQLQSEADKRRRAEVDAKNKADAARAKASMNLLAKTPLNAEEMAFCLRVEPRMNNGRFAERLSPADILRYSKLKGRMTIKAEVPEQRP